jgi:ketosteroid isomerase-like protein
MGIYAPDAIHEFPFAPAGAIDRLEGRDSIEAYMNQLPSLIQFGSLTDVLVREVDDELIIEATGHHTRLSDGYSFDLRYVWFITRQSGKVTRIRDYMNPLQLAVLSHATE